MLYVVGNTKKKIVVRNSATGEEKAYSLKKLKKKKENIYGVYHGKKNEVTGFTTLSFMTLPKLEKINENIIYGIIFKKKIWQRYYYADRYACNNVCKHKARHKAILR